MRPLQEQPPSPLKHSTGGRGHARRLNRTLVLRGSGTGSRRSRRLDGAQTGSVTWRGGEAKMILRQERDRDRRSTGCWLLRLAVVPRRDASSVSTRPGVSGAWARAPPILAVLAGRLSIVLQEGPVEMAPVAEARLLGDLIGGKLSGQQQMGGS